MVSLHNNFNLLTRAAANHVKKKIESIQIFALKTSPQGILGEIYMEWLQSTFFILFWMAGQTDVMWRPAS